VTLPRVIRASLPGARSARIRSLRTFMASRPTSSPGPNTASISSTRSRRLPTIRTSHQPPPTTRMPIAAGCRLSCAACSVTRGNSRRNSGPGDGEVHTARFLSKILHARDQSRPFAARLLLSRPDQTSVSCNESSRQMTSTMVHAYAQLHAGNLGGPAGIRTQDQGIHVAPKFPSGVDYLFTLGLVPVGCGTLNLSLRALQPSGSLCTFQRCTVGLAQGCHRRLRH